MIKIGDKAEYKRIFTMQDVKLFAELSMDTNPIHIDSEYGAQSRFGANIVHGCLVSSMFSKVIATQLPGVGSIYLSQSNVYKKPVYIGEEVKAVVTVKEIKKEKNIYVFVTEIMNLNDEVLVTGEAAVMYEG